MYPKKSGCSPRRFDSAVMIVGRVLSLRILASLMSEKERPERSASPNVDSIELLRIWERVARLHQRRPINDDCIAVSHL